ncbi:MAG: cbb3-type cytochrome c oxidase subunit II [Parachlamydiaceae bacterium]|nr:cbb3-type cytochrome c oxidase subunit II [Parachlamydiaceae bacterium]
MSEHNRIHNFIHNLDASAILTIIGIILLFSTAIIVTLIAPRYVDPSWTEPTNPYQVQMYEISDPNLYISVAPNSERQFLYHLKQNFTLLSFEETDHMRIIASPELEKYITKVGDKLKLTSRLLMLRLPEDSAAETRAAALRIELQQKWATENTEAIQQGELKPSYAIFELYVPEGTEAFAIAPSDGVLENWAEQNFTILEEETPHAYHKDPGVIYVKNPREYRIGFFKFGNKEEWRYDPKGKRIASLEELKNHPVTFHSRQELISMGEQIFAIEGCWYCHTDQTRTLVQDVVLNGSDSYPAPPSSANEYIYQKITFPGTRRIGPDLSRVGVKRPSRDWHKGHFWSPKTASQGSIMPMFRHFFDDDPRGTSSIVPGLPNYKFEAIFQYMMTKGTRITPPTQAWWLGKDPIKTKELIETKFAKKQL